MQKLFVTRQIVARSFYLLPFLLAFLTIPAPFKVLVACLLVIKIKMTDETERSEVMHLLNYVASNMAREDKPLADKWLGSMRKAFLLNEGIDMSEVELGPLKIKVDLAFNIFEMLLAIIFIFVSMWLALF